MDKIGLFPLNLVLFPESIYPLHIFEDRYKLLINTSIDENKEFGINLVTNNKMYDIGCTAKVLNVLKRYEDGRMDINVIGVRRYRLRNVVDGESIYYLGYIDYLFDDVNNYDRELFVNTAEIYNSIVNTVSMSNIPAINPDGFDLVFPSFFFAQKTGMDLEQRQRLLELMDENSRLKFMNNHLKSLLPVISENETINKMIKFDGYISPRKLL